MAKLVPIRQIRGDIEALSDAALLAGCAQGDAAALASIFDRYATDIHRFLSRLAGVDGDVADDLLQDTFLQVPRAARRFEGRSSARTWLFAIAANVARRHVRTDSRRHRAMDNAANRPCAPVPGPSDLVNRAELSRLLADAIARLPHKLRVVFIMCEVEEIKGVDAARALGLRVGTLYRRLHDARRRLRAELEGVWP